MRHTLARGLSRAVVQARPGPGGLAVIPVEEEQGKGTHHEEEEDPHSEACVVFDGLAEGAQVLASPWTVSEA